MATLKDLKKLSEQREALTVQIESMQKEMRQQAITQAAQLLADAGLSIDDLIGFYKATPAQRRKVGKPGPKPAAGPFNKAKPTKVAPKYRNKDTGDTWSGRGLKPRWLTAALKGGKKIDDFAI